MYEFNNFIFNCCVWYYAKRLGVIDALTWEIIIAKATNSQWVPGDHFMADVVNPEYLCNVKSLKKKFAKGDKQSLTYVQCRAPISKDRTLLDDELGSQIILTLIQKKQESFDQFSCNIMKDFLIQHYRDGEKYFARVFLSDHPDFNNYELQWKDGEGKIESSKSWFIKRAYGDSKHGQNCVHIKKVFEKSTLIADIVVECPDEHNVSNELIVEEYLKYHQGTDERLSTGANGLRDSAVQ